MGSSSGKIRVAVLFGGRSSEHEISLISAASVIEKLDRDRFEVIPIGIDRAGKWHLGQLPPSLAKKNPQQALPGGPVEVVLQAALEKPENRLVGVDSSSQFKGIDVAFPVLHGPLCEDGSLQGLLELAGLPYVGSGVLGSAIAMDKEVAKRLAVQSGVPVVPYLTVRKSDWKSGTLDLVSKINSTFGFPVFVKPVNMGSSVGVHKVKTAADLQAAVEDAFQYDLKILIEQGLKVREIEFAVLENIENSREPLVSVPGEIIPQGEFYSYEAKYVDANGAKLVIPAELTPEQLADGQEIVKRAFIELECEGMARVDLFLDQASGKILLNEVNTIPGFTSISMYPKLWEATGVSYSALLTKLIELALKRHERREGMIREWSGADPTA